MSKRSHRAFLMACVFAALSQIPAGWIAVAQAQGQNLASPPVAPVKPVTTNYYGTKVVDPYRYMENLKDPKVKAWMKAQNDYTRAVLARIPGREKIWSGSESSISRSRRSESSGCRETESLRAPGTRLRGHSGCRTVARRWHQPRAARSLWGPTRKCKRSLSPSRELGT
jgi:Prolyl oligopeptidase, N-terminal beta-propeller domain